MNHALSEYLTAQFYAWEKRGRGWHVFDQAVELESKFIPFFGHYPPATTAQIDDGVRPRFFPGLQEALGIFKKRTGTSIGEEAYGKLEELYTVNGYIYENPNPVIELTINFGKETRIVFEHIEQLLLMLSTSAGIVGFEIFGTREKITIQFVCTGRDANNFRSYISTYAPDVGIHESPGNLKSSIDFDQIVWAEDSGPY